MRLASRQCQPAVHHRQQEQSASPGEAAAQAAFFVGHHSLHSEVARLDFYHAPVGVMPDDTLYVLVRQPRLDFPEGSGSIEFFAAVRDELMCRQSFRVALDFRAAQFVCAVGQSATSGIECFTMPLVASVITDG